MYYTVDLKQSAAQGNGIYIGHGLHMHKFWVTEQYYVNQVFVMWMDW